MYYLEKEELKLEQEFIHILNIIQQSDDNQKNENNLVLSIGNRINKFVHTDLK